jgi:hypothetical protein
MYASIRDNVGYAYALPMHLRDNLKNAWKV